MNSVKSLPLLALSIVLALIIGCTQQSPNSGNETLEFGNTALVDYMLRIEIFNATANQSREIVYDTSIESVARENGIYSGKRKYESLLVEMKNDNGLLPGFTRALVRMKEGENKTFVLKPEDAYGNYNSSRVLTMKKSYNTSRYHSTPLHYFEINNISTEPGANFSTDYWVAQVMNSTNNSVTVKYTPELNKTFVFEGIPRKVVSFDEENMFLEIAAESGGIYRLKTPSGESMPFLVTAMNETDITFDANHQLAGKTLEFTVFVRKIQKSSS